MIGDEQKPAEADLQQLLARFGTALDGLTGAVESSGVT